WPRGDPRRAARRRCATVDEPGVDDLRHRAGDRADDRWLDPGVEPLADDLLVPGAVLVGSVSGDVVVVAGDASAGCAAGAAAAAIGARLPVDPAQPTVPAAGRGGGVQLR